MGAAAVLDDVWLGTGRLACWECEPLLLKLTLSLSTMDSEEDNAEERSLGGPVWCTTNVMDMKVLPWQLGPTEQCDAVLK